MPQGGSERPAGARSPTPRHFEMPLPSAAVVAPRGCNQQSLCTGLQWRKRPPASSTCPVIHALCADTSQRTMACDVGRAPRAPRRERRAQLLATLWGRPAGIDGPGLMACTVIARSASAPTSDRVNQQRERALPQGRAHDPTSTARASGRWCSPCSCHAACRLAPRPANPARHLCRRAHCCTAGRRGRGTRMGESTSAV